MFTVKSFTSDPVLDSSKSVHEESYQDKTMALGVAEAGAKNGYWMGVYDDSGELIARFEEANVAHYESPTC